MIRPTLLLASSLFLLTACGPKAPVVVVVSVDRVAQESVRAKKIIGDVEGYAKSVEDKLNEMAQEIQAASADPRRSPAELNAMKLQWNQLRQTAVEQVDQRRRKAEDDVHQALDETLKILAKEQGWDLVVREDRHSALWAKPVLDKTDLVIQRMDTLAPASVPPNS